MSAVDSTFPERDYNTLSKKHVSGLLSLNEVLRESLRKAQARVNSIQLIVRCEMLPQVRAGREEMINLFDELLGIILNCPPNSSRLFLYVYCEEEASEVIDHKLEHGFKRFVIKLHTNITTHDNWKLINSQALINSRHILSRHNGSLLVNDISNTGCLFSISLPGKLNKDASK
jgi:hypothetical protein